MSEPADWTKDSYFHQFKDPAPEVPFGWIQWKGTRVCMDIHCTCGAHLHADTDFLYHVRCGECKKLYHVSGYVKMLEVTGDDLKRFNTGDYRNPVELKDERD